MLFNSIFIYNFFYKKAYNKEKFISGSASVARVKINNITDAQNLQDLAAERCSMPYKAPELFNVENHSMIDERTDIWVSQCVLT